MPRRIIIDTPYGQLGNTLFRLANVVAFAKENAISVWDRSLYDRGYARLFPQVRNRLFLSFPDSSLLPMSGWPFQAAQSRLIKHVGRVKRFHNTATENRGQDFLLTQEELFTPQQKTVVLRGFHYYADDAVERQADYVRWLFTPHEEVVRCAKEEEARFREGADRLVALHIRRGDFATWEGGKFFFEMDYYRTVAKRVAEIYAGEQVRFVVCSDDPELDLSCLEGFDYVRVSRYSSISFDWFIMSHCDLLVATLYSTYPAWSSFYGEVPMFRLDGESLPRAAGDFVFKPNLNASKQAK